MIFAGIDVNIITHPKAGDAGIEAMGLWMWGMCYAQLHATDGALPRKFVLGALHGRRNIMLAARLVAARLWTANEDGSWQIYNYGLKNQSAAEIRKKKELAAERSRKWRERRDAAVTRHRDAAESVRIDPELQTPPDNRKQKTDNTINLCIGAAEPLPTEPVTKVRRKRKPETACPPSDAPASDVATWSDGWKIHPEHPEFVRFLDHHRSKENHFRDWSAAWRTWLGNATKFGRRAADTRQPLFDPASAPWLKASGGGDL